MPLTEDDIRAVLEERSADLVAPPDLVGAVRHRVRVRRLRAFTGAAAVVAAGVAVALGVTVPNAVQPRPVPPAAPSPTAPSPAPHPSVDPRNPITASGLPTYEQGGKVLAGARFRTADRREMTIRFTPTSWHLHITINCTGSLPGKYMLDAVVNGQADTGSNCAGGATSSSAGYGQEETYWRALGVRLHQPSTLVLQVVRGNLTKPHPATYEGPLPDAQVEFGVYQRVPIADYPFPPRPRHLQKVSVSLPNPVLVDIKPTDGKFNGSFTTTFVMRRHLQIATSTVEPGSLTLLVNGVPVNQIESWTYSDEGSGTSLSQLGDYGVHPRVGQRVRLTVLAKRFTDPAWEVAVGRDR